jgi:hypothetical protein
MKVTVQHINQNEITGSVEGFTDVAEVNVWHTEDIDEALEYAYRYTNNVDGSWSMKIGADANDDVTVLAPLHVANGRTYGLRSTSMFDRMVANGKTYKVAMMGFKEVETV